jgi:hypothetical protein
MLITVTQEHIERGKKKNCAECPVALALHDAGFPDAYVSFDRVWASPDDRLNNYNCLLAFLPILVRVWISNFDSGKHVEPFEFELILRWHR